MKILILILFFYFTYGSENIFRSENAWEEFKIEYQKNYNNPLIELQRKSVFLNNLKMIEKFNSEKHSYEQGINEFSDLTYEETMESLGILGGLPMRSLIRNTTYKSSNGKLPPNVPNALDWRNKDGENYVTHVRKQGKCNSWWAIAAIESLESLFYIHGQVDKLTPLSVQQILDCGRHTCRGGLVADAYLYIIENGIVSERNYPYKSSNGKARECKVKLDKSVGKIRGMELAMTEMEVINALVKVGPLAVYTCLPESFTKYKKGIYNDPKCNPSPDSAFCEKFQAMNLVGYGTEDGVGYWIVKNSWGRWWGEKGYIRVARANERCWIPFYARFPML